MASCWSTMTMIAICNPSCYNIFLHYFLQLNLLQSFPRPASSPKAPALFWRGLDFFMFLNAHRPFQTVNSKNFAFERHRKIVLPTADQLAMAKKRNVTRKSSETNKGSPNYGTAKIPLYQQLIRYYLPYCEIFRYQKCYQNFLVFECFCLWNKIKKVHHIND